MATSDYSGHRVKRIDEPVWAAQASAPGEKLRLRIQPQLFVKKATDTIRGGTYLGWKGVFWNVSCESVAEVIAIRDALVRFFALLEHAGVDYVIEALDNLLNVPVESAPLTPNETQAHE